MLAYRMHGSNLIPHWVKKKSAVCPVTLEDEDGSQVTVIQSIDADSSSGFDLFHASWPTLLTEQEQQGKTLL